MDVNSGPDVMEQLPAGGGVSKPDSGSYGDKAAAAKLKQDLGLPGTGAGPATQPVPSMPGMPPGGRPPTSPPPGAVPDVLMGPTTQPDVPASTPLGGPPRPGGAVGADQKRLQLLMQLADSPNVSEETQQWAQLVLDKLAAGRR